jgi:hypothetical protein
MPWELNAFGKFETFRKHTGVAVCALQKHIIIENKNEFSKRGFSFKFHTLRNISFYTINLRAVLYIKFFNQPLASQSKNSHSQLQHKFLMG